MERRDRSNGDRMAFEGQIWKFLPREERNRREIFRIAAGFDGSLWLGGDDDRHALMDRIDEGRFV